MDSSLLLTRITQAAVASDSPEPFLDALSILPQVTDKCLKRALSRYLRGIAEDRVVSSPDAARYVEFVEGVLRENASDDFDSYMLYMEWGRDPERQFYRPRRHVLYPLVCDLQDLFDGKLDFLSISLPPRVGKALDFDTPVLTENGWKKHGDLTIRDRVLSPNGSFVDVIAIHPVCDMEYEVEFTNGEKVVCHGEHEWRVFNRHGQKYEDLTVNEMLSKGIETGEPGKRGHRHMFMLPPREPLQGTERTLPVEPYTLGAWLGDGRNTAPDICGAESDYAIVEGVLEEGYELAWDTKHKTTGVRYYGFNGLRPALQSVGMCYSRHREPKRIPDCYFTASVGQRLALLAGLLDTDGCLLRGENRYQFTTSDPLLKDGFVKLVSTFGWRASVQELPPRQHGAIKGGLPYWTICFNPTMHIPCRLERKQLFEFSKQRRIAVKSITPVQGRKGNCITVDGGMYCVGDTLVPTHNSTLCIFFLTFVMGNYPNRANVMSGHSDKLTKSFHMEAMSIITDQDTYRFAEVFPDSPLVYSSQADETIHLKRKRRFPTLTCRSIDGTLTGAVEVGRDALLYCDDLVSDREEALSADRMEKLYAAYLNQLKDRMNDGAKQLFVGTRWVPDDPIGRIEAQYEGNPRYRFTVIPALDADGETNFSYLYGMGFSKEYYEDMRASLYAAGEGDSWDAKYMGAPRYIGGLMFSEDQLRFYDGLPEGEPDAVLAVCDTKDRGKDYACLPVAYQYGEDFYIDDCVCDNDLPEVVEPKILRCLIGNGVQLVRFESNLAGGRIADDMARQCRERGHLIDVRKKYSTENKETRILVDSMWVKEHCLFRAEPPHADYRAFLTMLTHYSTEGRNKHDDAPDAMSMLKRFVQSLVGGTVTPMKRMF